MLRAGNHDLPSSSSQLTEANADDAMLDTDDTNEEPTPDTMKIDPAKVGIKYVPIEENLEQIYRSYIWNTT